MRELITSFLLIFFAALPGRTTFVLIALATRCKAQTVLAGAALAFAIQCFLSVLLGKIISGFPTIYVHFAAGILFLWFGVKFWKESKHALTEDKKNSSSFAAIFSLVFIAEFGDVSQLAIATEAARTSSLWTIFFISIAAMWTITGGAVFVGKHLHRALNPSHLQKIAAVAFFSMGIYLIVSSSGILH